MASKNNTSGENITNTLNYIHQLTESKKKCTVYNHMDVTFSSVANYGNINEKPHFSLFMLVQYSAIQVIFT